MSWVALILAIPLILFGAHGLYAYFQQADTFFGIVTGNYDKLFFSISVPHQVAGLISWMSLRATQSFIIPGIFEFCGLWLAHFGLSRGLSVSLPKWKGWRRSQPRRIYRPYKQNMPVRPRTVVIKVLLNLIMLIGIILLSWYGYNVFTHKTSPIIGALFFLFGTAILCALIWVFRRRYMSSGPSFKITALIVSVIIIVFAFAGAEPLSSAKDTVFRLISEFVH